jgi:hypothetical protein
MISGPHAALIVGWFVATVWDLATNSDLALVVVLSVSLVLCGWALVLAAVWRVVPGYLGLIEQIEHPSCSGLWLRAGSFGRSSARSG